VNAKDKEGTNSLMAAAARGHLECIQSLVAAEGVDVNGQNVDGHTALMFAYNGKNQVETLWERYSQFVSDVKLEKGAGTVEGGDGEAALAREGDEAVAMTTGEDKKDVDDGGTGPLIQEALKNHTMLVEILINAGRTARSRTRRDTWPRTSTSSRMRTARCWSGRKRPRRRGTRAGTSCDDGAMFARRRCLSCDMRPRGKDLESAPRMPGCRVAVGRRMFSRW
jgi:hypothetical protein